MSSDAEVVSGPMSPGERTGYILDMLLQLAAMALNNGEPALASAIVQTIETYAARSGAGPALPAAAGPIGVGRA